LGPIDLLTQGSSTMNEKIAKLILTFGFNDAAQQRMEYLTEAQQKGTLSDAEKQELTSYEETGRLLALLQTKARLYLERDKEVD
jgi:hypothetical protein